LAEEDIKNIFYIKEHRPSRFSEKPSLGREGQMTFLSLDLTIVSGSLPSEILFYKSALRMKVSENNP
jgi:hypothetical protein